MTRNTKISAILAVLVIGFLSIYASTIAFNSGNQTQQQLTFTLNMQSGAQIPVTVNPGQNVPTNLNGDQIVGMWVFGAYVPGGVNAVVQGSSGTVTIMWQMSGGTPIGAVGVTSTTTIS